MIHLEQNLNENGVCLYPVDFSIAVASSEAQAIKVYSSVYVIIIIFCEYNKSIITLTSHKIWVTHLYVKIVYKNNLNVCFSECYG
jgi:hypothetical protein